jgi:hypothetical protein
VNEDKSELDPSQDFVGVRFRTAEGLMSPPQDRIVKIQDLVRQWRRALVSQPGSFFCSWACSTRRQIKCLRATCTCAPFSSSHSGAPTRTRCTGRSGAWETSWGRSGITGPQSYGSLAPPAPEISMFTDASLYGWGAHVGTGDLSAKGTWTEERSLTSPSTFWR